ncbi:phosphoadenylyl-sulfate reductase [Niveispirillum cyanobacteriorum]|uniref:Adenosine 5'-phosphosulfate reductase n=1 Tax=Niveispirillum cyanobacteriorum TaxID=1612173 RepID=A0A2K9NKE5_9PROT|nr:phosphoadenylyl-sulfate reductase [Niveispirillum cyanobacteriorum]AUN33547.1 phosphoadenylyl-sulfate reductase [Niveispirillum cyanobacteriorum]GGE47619.1 phosphoadenosine phosphosulfate reductase [Niveispirillum cyanobacteriorum]
MITDLQARARDLNARYGHLEGVELLQPLIETEFKGQLALVSSFGTESAVLLHMVAQIDRDLPILFVNTRKLFGETLRYKRKLVETLGLTGLRELSPTTEAEAANDKDGLLWRTSNTACCDFRKVQVLNAGLAPFSAWITGRKRYQATTRIELPLFEAADGRIKINPLAGYTRADVESYLDRHGLPRHPLEEDGYLSVGCMPCTDRVAPGEDIRAGRWRGQEKTECGIHLPLSSATNLVGAS